MKSKEFLMVEEEFPMLENSFSIIGNSKTRVPVVKPQSRTEVKTLIFMAIISGRGQIFVVPVRIFGLEPVYHTG